VQLNRISLQTFLTQDTLNVEVNAKNKTDQYKVGEVIIDFLRLKNASIVEQENTMKKQLGCVFPVLDSDKNAKGEIEVTMSIEDFGNVEDRESFISRQGV